MYDEPPYTTAYKDMTNEKQGEDNSGFQDQFAPNQYTPPPGPVSGTPPLSASSPVHSSPPHSATGFATVPLSPGVSPTAPYAASSQRGQSYDYDPAYVQMSFRSDQNRQMSHDELDA